MWSTYYARGYLDGSEGRKPTIPENDEAWAGYLSGYCDATGLTVDEVESL